MNTDAPLHPTLRTLMSPLRELDFSNKLRTHKLNFPQSTDLAMKQILFRSQRLQASGNCFNRLLSEAGCNIWFPIVAI